MVYVNANLDQKTNKILRTGRLTKALSDLCEEVLYITFVARDRHFINEASQEDGESFLRVVLPYEEVLKTENIDLLAFQQLYKQLHLLKWLNVEEMKKELEIKIQNLR